VPAWALDLPEAIESKVFDDMPRLFLARPRRNARGARWWVRDEGRVWDTIPDEIALPASWSLRFAHQQSNPKGRVSCHAIDRPDANPSAGFSPGSCVYAEMRDGVRPSFFDLAVGLGAWGAITSRVDRAFRSER
jgi:hypothetical protein